MPYSFDDDDTDRKRLQEQIDSLSDQLDRIPYNAGEQGRSYHSPDFVTFPTVLSGSSGRGNDSSENSEIRDYGEVSGTVTIDQTYKGHRITLEGDIEIQFDDNADDQNVKELIFFITQKAGQSYAVAWPDSVVTQKSIRIHGTANTDVVTHLVGYTADGGVTYQISNVNANKVILGDTGNVFLGGTEDPTGNLGADLDFFIQKTTNHLWRKVSRVWNDLGAMLGQDGAQGPAGADGKSIVLGQADPVTVQTGFKEGDSFLNTANGALFEVVRDAQTGILQWVRQVSTIFGEKGDAGPKGDTGTDGPKGDVGPQGPRGPGIVSGQADPVTVETGFIEGDKLLNTINGKLFEVVKNSQTQVLEWVEQISSIIGSDGTDGNDGEDGNEWFAEDAGDVLSAGIGKIGDFFVTASNVLLQKIAKTADVATSWGTLQTAFGAKGDVGNTGPQGDAGADGLSILNGSGPPSGTLGVTTQIYIDNDTSDYYVKTSSGWQLQKSLEGPAGIQGPVGPRGADGAAGPKGDAGIQGPQGAQGPAGNNGTRGTRTTAGAYSPVGVFSDAMEGDQHYDLTDFSVWFASDVNGAIEWFQEIDTVKGADGIDAETNNLGTISGNQTFDLNTISKDFISSVIDGNTVINFTNIPDILALQLRAVIKTTGSTLTVSGENLPVNTTSGDIFIIDILKLGSEASIQVSFQSEAERINFPVSLPQDFEFVGVSDQEIQTNWNPPSTGNVPITYDLAYSTSPSVDENGTPNGADAVFVNDITNIQKLIESLVHSTTYYGFLRCKNSVSTSNWIGPIQTNTDAPLTDAILNFSVTSPDFQTIQGSWESPPNREYRYDFDLIDPGGTVDEIRNSSLSESFARDRLIPNSEYGYTFRVYNEYGRLVYTKNGTVTTASLPVPTKTVSVSGTTINVDITIPAGIENVKLELDTKNDFSSSNYPTQDILRSVGSNISEQEVIQTSFPNLNPSTEYFLRTSSEFLGEQSDYSETESIITGAYLAPYYVSAVSATSPDVGQVRLRWRWGGSYRGEWASVIRYQQNVLGFVDEGVFFRINEIRDLDDRENRCEIILENQPSNERWVYAVTPRNQTGPGGADTDSVLID